MSEAVGSGIGIGSPSSCRASSIGSEVDSFRGNSTLNSFGTVNNCSTFDQGSSSWEA